MTNSSSKREPIRIGLATSRRVRDLVLTPANLQGLDALGSLSFAEFNEPGNWEPGSPPSNPAAEAELGRFARDLDALIICHGAPKLTASVMEQAPNLKFVGELEGDRFAQRIDLDAAWARGIVFVDTNQAASFPAAEWALGLTLAGLRNAGAHFRRMFSHQFYKTTPELRNEDPGFHNGLLSRKRVGLIGLGYLGRRLRELLNPFQVEVRVYDPYAPRELADALDVTFTSLDRVFASSDVVICTAPLTPGTRGLVGARQLELLRPHGVFVNVSRGAIVDTQALIARASKGDLIACLDVLDPEPVPVDTPLRDMPNVLLTPHIAGVTASNFPSYMTLMIDEIVRHFDGDEPRSAVLAPTVRNRTS